MKVADGVFSYVWKGYFVNNANMFYFGEPLNILFDPGLKNYMDTRFGEMKSDGINPDDVRHVVNTHCHPDHFEGSLYYNEKNIPLAMHEDEIAFYNKLGPQFFQMFGMSFPGIDFQVILKEGTWEVSGVELQVYHTPGHSPGSICVYWKEKKALVCGDLVFEQSVGRVDFPGGDAKKLVESIKKISRLDIEILLPGHMNIITGADAIQKNFELIERYYFSML
ncbi:MAG TPA: MBL fold metallo-hydrolase [Spirochaetota bacterium]|nr:MBL fold metallo-hydrolase [Spirochaetota bacterium]HPG52022.1 MBL fold metallo-hydrolase [Spirochaetota bacterium]HPN11884.1 MBL fold metallo-hydrolase [Spirochaetota bacterium]HQL83715.1 MBL fold metallo-hydrolase [Spirochaetota bacterium]